MNYSKMGRSWDTYGFCGRPEGNVLIGRVKRILLKCVLNEIR